MRPTRLPKPLLLSLLAAAAFPAMAEQGAEAQLRDSIMRAVPAFVAGDDSTGVATAQEDAAAAGLGAVRIVSDEAAGAAAIQTFVSVSSGLMPATAVSSLNPAASQSDRSRLPGNSRNVSASWSAVDAQWWQPSVHYSLEEEHARPVSPMELAAASAMQGTPDLSAHAVIAEWTHSALRMGYRVSSASQREAFSTRSDAAARSRGQGTYVGVALAEGIDLQADFGADVVRDASMPAAMRWQTRSLAAQWSSLDRRWNVRSGIADSRTRGDDLMPALTSQTADVTLTYTLSARTDVGSASAPQIYVRLDRQAVRGAGTSASAAFSQIASSLNLGVSFGF